MRVFCIIHYLYPGEKLISVWETKFRAKRERNRLEEVNEDKGETDYEVVPMEVK